MGHLTITNLLQMKFFQFSFRWMNCLLAREVSVLHIPRRHSGAVSAVSMDKLVGTAPGFLLFLNAWLFALIHCSKVHIQVLIRIWDTCFAECDMLSRDGVCRHDEFACFVEACAPLLHCDNSTSQCSWISGLQAASLKSSLSTCAPHSCAPGLLSCRFVSSIMQALLCVNEIAQFCNFGHGCVLESLPDHGIS